MDRELRSEIVALVGGITEKVQREHWELYHEEWVTPKELCKRIGCFNAGWMKSYARTLPRTQPIVLDENNVEHYGSWIYPLHKIQRMVMEGKIKQLRMKSEDITIEKTNNEY